MTIHADAPSSFLSALTLALIDPSHVRVVLVALFAFMVKVGATLGLFAALSHHVHRPPTPIARWAPKGVEIN